MSNVNLEAYLFFKGNCREAMEFYKNIFGGELTITTMADAPAIPGMPNVDKSWVMHASLEGGAVKLMASDSQNASDKSAKVELSLTGSDEPAMRKMFDGLSEGGTVKMALEKQFWGDMFGNLQDKFGVDWNMNIGDMSGGQKDQG